MIGWMYYADGSPRMETTWCRGRPTGREQASVELEAPKQFGQTVLVHMGNGHFLQHEVVDGDDDCVLLKAVK